MTELRIVNHAAHLGASADDDALDTVLRIIAVGFSTENEWAEKYGTLYENDVFSMHPYCWCEKDDCAWCSGSAPNFVFKPANLRVTWYKYIGRGVEVDADVEVTGELVLEAIFATHPTGMTATEAFVKLNDRTAETQRVWTEMMQRLNQEFGGDSDPR